MIREISLDKEKSILEEKKTGGLGELSFYHPVGTFALTPASDILIQAIIHNKDMLKGIGIDWGTGVGCLAILAAKVTTVDKVFGFDISKDNINTARINAEKNCVSDKVYFMLGDSYCPFQERDKLEIEQLKGKVDFILSNSPSSDWDDGFGFRRIVLDGAKEYLKKDGIVLLNISFQYGAKRVESLYNNSDGFKYMGLAASTDWVPFDLQREDLLECLKVYVQEELKGGTEYTFSENGSNDNFINAQKALNNFNTRGISPLTKWQTHMFKYHEK